MTAIILCGLLGALEACVAHKVATTETSSWQAHREQMARLVKSGGAWSAQGKLRVSHGGKNWLLKFKWVQKKNFYEVDIYSAFDKLASFKSSAQGVHVSGQRVNLVTATPEEAANRLLGFPAPVTLMQHWILGLTSPRFAVEQFELNARGLAHIITQQGWRIDYASYQRIDNYAVPEEFSIEHGQTKLKAWVNEWKFSPASTQI